MLEYSLPNPFVISLCLLDLPWGWSEERFILAYFRNELCIAPAHMYTIPHSLLLLLLFPLATECLSKKHYVHKKISGTIKENYNIYMLSIVAFALHFSTTTKFIQFVVHYYGWWCVNKCNFLVFFFHRARIYCIFIIIVNKLLKLRERESNFSFEWEKVSVHINFILGEILTRMLHELFYNLGITQEFCFV